MDDQIDSRELRNALGCFATGVTVVTMRLPDGRPEGLTVNSFAAVSLQPALALFSVNRASRCAAWFERIDEIAIHILDAHHTELCQRFARKGGTDWSDIAWQPGRAGAPILDDCKTGLECTVQARLDGGDHIIVIARIKAIRQHDSHDPLVFYRGHLHSIAPTRNTQCG